MEKFVIAELLMNCPEGMELDCTIWDNVVFSRVDMKSNYPICIKKMGGDEEYLTENGCFNFDLGAKCVIFPKGKTTWEGFVPPCKFKDGDILVHSQNQRFVMSIYHRGISELLIKTHCILWGREEGLSVNQQICCYADSTRLANEEEKQKLFEAIKRNGYEWNSETKTLERMVVPKFKVGDTVRHEEDKTVIIIIEIKDDYYVMQSYDQYSSGGYQYTKIPIKDQDQYKLFNFHDKLDISTLEKIEPKFKVGDKIRLKNDKNTIETINYIFSDSYRLYSDSYGLGSHHLLFFKEQDEWELVPDKFDISTLKPFDKVLGRTDNTGIWECDLFSCYNDSELYNNFHCIGVNYRYCIPYEGNEHLLGTTDDCNDFYKTWEE